MDERELRYTIRINAENPEVLDKIAKSLDMTREEVLQWAGSVDKGAAAAHAASKANTTFQDSFAPLPAKINEARTATNAFAVDLERLGRGFASSVFNFTLLAGGWVAAGHIIGNAVRDAINAAEELDRGLAKLKANVPDLDLGKIRAEIMEAQRESGVLATVIIDNFSRVQQSIQGTDEALLTFATDLGQSAKANSQNQVSYTDAVVGSMQAYKLELSDAAHVQDVVATSIEHAGGKATTLVARFNELNQSASEANQTLDENAAAMVALANSGGNVVNLYQGLKQIYEQLPSERVVKGFREIGVSVLDVDKKIRPLGEILSDVKAKLESMPQGEQSKALSNIFSDRTASETLRSLITLYPQYSAALDRNTVTTGQNAQKVQEFRDSLEGSKASVDAFFGAIGQGFGTLVDYKGHIAGLVDVTKAAAGANQTNNAATKDWIATQQQADALATGTLDQYGNWVQATKEVGEAHTAAGGEIQGFSEVVADTISKAVESAGALDTESANSLKNLDSNYLATSLSIEDHLDDYDKFMASVTDSVRTKIDQHAQAYSDLRNNLSADLAALQIEHANYQSKVQTTTGAASIAAFVHAQNVANDMRSIQQNLQAAEQEWNNYYAAAGGSLVQRFNTAKIGLQGATNTADIAAANAKGAHEIANDADKSKTAADAAQLHAHANTEDAKATLAADQAILQKSQALDQLRGETGKSAETMAAEAQVARDSMAVTKAQVTEINAAAKATIARNDAAAAKRNNAADKKADTAADAGRRVEEQLNEARATEAVTKARQDLDRLVKQYDGDLDHLRSTMHQMEQQDKVVLDGLKAGWERAKVAAEVYAESSKRGVAELTEKVYQDQQAIYALEQSWKSLIEADKRELAGVLSYLRQVEAETTAQDQRFDRQAHEISQRAQAVEDEMETARRGEAVLNDELEREQRARTALADLWESRILPVQLRLQAIREQERKLDTADKLHEEATGIENIAARLAVATGAERTQLQFQLDAARRRHALHTEEENLQQRLTKLENDRDAALRGADAQIKATQARIEATRDEEKAIAARQQAIADEQKLLDRQRAEFDYQQGQKRIAAQEDANTAQDKLDRAQGLADAATKPYRDEIAEIEHARTVKEHDDGLELTRLQNAANSQKVWYEFVRDNVYQPQIDKIKETITNLEDQKKAAIKPYQEVLDFVQKNKSDLTAAYKLIEQADTATDKGAKQTSEMANAVALAHDVITKILPDLPPLGTALGDNFDKGTTGAQKLKTDGLDPLKVEMDKTKPETFAGLWDKAFNYNVVGSAPDTIATAYHLMGNDSILWKNGVISDVNQVEAKYRELATLLDSRNWTPPGTSPSPTGKADGGPVDANTMYMVGERGPELFVSRTGGVIHSNASLRAGMRGYGGGGGGGITKIEVHAHFNGAPLITKEAITYTVARAIDQGLNQYYEGTGRGKK
jgi:hypothetical protein